MFKETDSLSLSKKLQQYHKWWKRKHGKHRPPRVPTRLYQFDADNDDDTAPKNVETYLISEYNTRIYVNDDLTTVEKLIARRQSIVISNDLVFKCPVCLDMKSVYFIQLCGHCLCRGCLVGLTSTASTDKCVVCRHPNNKEDGHIIIWT